MLAACLDEQLQKQKERDSYRRHRLSQPLGGGKTRVDGRACINFSSNDYLGLSLDPGITRAYQEGIERYGFTSGGSSLISGYHPAHQALEDAFADFLGRERALFFPSGYTANIGVLSTFLSSQSEVLIDKLSHASVYDGLRLSGAKVRRYRHRDIAHANSQCAAMIAEQRWLVSESVFSMSGQLAGMSDLLKLAEQQNLNLVIDDAHGIGVLGDRGQGCIGLEGVGAENIELLISPLGKAFASTGAIVSGSHSLIETLINFSRPYIYSTAISPAHCHGLLATLRLIETESWRREQLRARIAYFKQVMKKLPLKLKSSTSAIQLLTLGNNDKALALSEYLSEKGIFCLAVRPPTVAANQAGLRVTINASHSESDIDHLYDSLSEYCDDTY